MATKANITHLSIIMTTALKATQLGLKIIRLSANRTAMQARTEGSISTSCHLMGQLHPYLHRAQITRLSANRKTGSTATQGSNHLVVYL